MQAQFNPKKIKLIIGLGNPGRQYENTYHNAGYLFLEFLNKTYKSYWSNRSYKSYRTDTFMNESGRFINSILKKTNTKPENLLLVHDDSDIALGQYKLQFGRGAAGHKGVASVIKALKTEDFWRLRIGIRPISPIGLIGPISPIGRIRRLKADEFVLKKISPAHRLILEKGFLNALEKMTLKN